MTCLNCPVSSSPGAPIHVLFVDDDMNQRDMYRRRLERRNLKVRVANDGDGALQLVRDERPDVVVLDVAMPDPDGLTVLQELLEVDPALPVVLHTAYPAYAEDFIAWAADGFVEKSQDLEPLL